MNVGYGRGAAMGNDTKCPICNSHVYGLKRGIDFTCTNEKCILNKKSGRELKDDLQIALSEL